MPDHIIELYQDLKDLPNVTRYTNFGGVYAWYFPEVQDENLLPLYIGQSNNLAKRCQKHRQMLDYAYAHNTDNPSEKYYKYYEIKHVLGLVGEEARPKEEFKVLGVFDKDLNKVDKLLVEQLNIAEHGSHIFGFNSPLPSEIYYLREELGDELWRVLVEQTVELADSALGYFDPDTKIGAYQTDKLQRLAIKRGNIWLGREYNN